MSDADTRLRACRTCRHFRNDPALIEAETPGLITMSSGYGSVRAQDGICLKHDRYLRADYSCPDFAEIPETIILSAARTERNLSPARDGGRQTSSYFSTLIAAFERRVLSDREEHAGVLSMTDLPHEMNGLEPPAIADWLAAFGTALVALIAIGILPQVLG
jgi:hypothetical protein